MSFQGQVCEDIEENVKNLGRGIEILMESGGTNTADGYVTPQTA